MMSIPSMGTSMLTIKQLVSTCIPPMSRARYRTRVSCTVPYSRLMHGTVLASHGTICICGAGHRVWGPGYAYAAPCA